MSVSIEENKLRRLLIFFFFDKDGIVDDYIPYLLNGISSHCSEILVMSNGELTENGRQVFSRFTKNVIERENKGFDVWAYKEALEYYSWDRLAEFDEVVLMNYTIFGPLYPFSEMFNEMDSRDVDFWGITKHHMVDFDCFKTCKYGYIPEHIQSNFIAVRKNMIKSPQYQKMWKDMPMIESYAESVGMYEAIFTKDFTDMGFKSDVYINTDDLEGYTRYPLLMMSHELVKNRRSPIIKVKAFSQNYYDILGDCIGNCTVDTFEYIQKNLDYNTEMIWQHILRTANMAGIKQLMHLNYILPRDYSPNPKTRDVKKVALMMHLYYPDLVEQCMNYAKSMPKGSDLIVTVPNDEMKRATENKAPAGHFGNIHVIIIENVGRDVSALLVGCAPYVFNYDYVCFMHDKKTTQLKPYCIGESFSYKCFENNLGSPEYVENIIAAFENNPRLGLLTPPPPNHGSFYQIVGSEWASNYDNTVSLAYKLKLNTNIYWEYEPIAPLGTMFWFRPRAMRVLFEYGWKYEDFPPEPNNYDGTLLHAIERIYAFVVQHEGYYPAWVMTDKFARIELTNLYFMLRQINLALFDKYYTTTLMDMTEKIKSNMQFNWTRDLGWKEYIRRHCPVFLWNFLRKIYHGIKVK